MSVKIMGAVWDYDIPRDEKFVLLAYADHAAHDGTSIYPAVATIAKKTGYSERSVQTITRKLEKMGLLIPDGKGARGTNKWRIPLEWGAISAPEKIAGVQPVAPALGAENGIAGVQPVAPEPSEESIKPSLKASEVPELVLFRSVTDKYPSRDNFSTVIETIREISKRLGRQVCVDDLLPFWKLWRAKGYRPQNLSWLTEWAVSGSVPQQGKPAQQSKPSLQNFQDQLLQWAETRQEAPVGTTT